MSRAPRTKETLPDFLKWRRVTRHPLVFRGLTGSQRTPGFWGVTGYPPSSQGFLSPPWARTWDHELRYPFEVVPTWSWVRALTEAKEKSMGHAPIAYEWDHPSSEWARGWGTYKKGTFFVRAPPPGPLRRWVVPLTGYPPSSQGFLSPPWARTWDHELRYPFEVVPTTN